MIDAVNTLFNSLMKIYPISTIRCNESRKIRRGGREGEGRGLNVIGAGPRLDNLQRKREAAN